MAVLSGGNPLSFSPDAEEGALLLPATSASKKKKRKNPHSEHTKYLIKLTVRGRQPHERAAVDSH